MHKTKVRMIDIANRARVSAATVSQVLNPRKGSVRVAEATALRIRQIAEELNYRPDVSAQMLAGKRSKIIGVIIDSYAPSVHQRTLAACEDLLAEHGYRIMIGQAHNNCEILTNYIKDFIAYNVDAIICFAHEYPEQGGDVSKSFGNFKNVVFVGRPKTDDAVFIDLDIKTGIEQLVELLHRKGRKRIAMVNRQFGYNTDFQRQEGYRAGLLKCGLQYDESLVLDMEVTSECVDYLLGQQVDAVLASNDRNAVLLIKEFAARGVKVPEDISVCGFDDDEIASLFVPELTTVNQDSKAQAQAVVKLTLDMLSGHECSITAVVKPKLIERKST
jgi:DNA-binding LacI/PurR family transcriptional regulator